VSLTDADVGRIVDLLAAAGRAEIMPRFARVRELDVRQKSSAFDVVTEADEAAEQVIAGALAGAFPRAAIIGEEAAARDPALLDGLASADLAFLVDPIDGTKNFVAGLPLFGSMIAATVRGEIVFGAIHDPVCGDTAVAVRGGGAWLARDGATRRALRVAPAVPVGRMDAIVGTNFLPEPLRSIVIANQPKLGMSSWLRCSAHEYRLAASGHCHLLLYNKLMPWDHAAGWLLHREAGGWSAHFDGSPYRPTNRTGGLLCAPDPASWQAAREALLGP
jgi:fructose-1,6-bisphosphatase/inositol monophosphatase family enzyme